MNSFALLLDRLSREASRKNKLRLIVEYFEKTADPDRGYALAALTGELVLKTVKPALLKSMVRERMDEDLFNLSYHYVGDLAETISLVWPNGPACAIAQPPRLQEVVEGAASSSRLDLPVKIAAWLDGLNVDGRWALLKLMTGNLRVGVSARLAKAALAEIGHVGLEEIEEAWHGLSVPYESLFAWVKGQGERPAAVDTAPFRPPMLAHAIDEAEFFERMTPSDYLAEWKWDGIRVQAVKGVTQSGEILRRIYSRSGDDVSRAFPELIDDMGRSEFDGMAIDAEALVIVDKTVQSFTRLQQRLNRKVVARKILEAHPVGLRIYDILVDRGEDVRALPLVERRKRLEAFNARLASPLVALSPLISFDSWNELRAARERLAAAEEELQAIEGMMIKRRDSAYLAGRPKGYWWKWKRDPMNVDAVLMYAQRGHGKRATLYSDFTFGLWRETPDGRDLTPVGKAYFGFTDDELAQLDRWVRKNTTNRFGPVREVAATPDNGLVLEIAFEGVNESRRHKSGVAMRFPRISRIRWDKPPREADVLNELKRLGGIQT